jgi:uncharacterized membrane protein
MNTAPLYPNKLFFAGTAIHRLLLTSVGFGCLLLAARIVYTGQWMFGFLAWNLFLAFIPYVISYQLTIRSSWLDKKWKRAIAMLAWLAFIPNSFYILTDLFHLFDSYQVPRWFDLLLIFTFAWNALLMGIMSVRHIEKIIQATWRYRFDWLFVFPVMWFNALGIYIGRYLRFNSWDIISNPFSLLADIGRILLHPLRYANAWGMIVCFSFFLGIIYLTIKQVSRTIAR